MNNILYLIVGMSLGGSLMALSLFALRPLLRKKGWQSVLYWLYIPVLLRFLLPLPGLLSVNGLYTAPERPSAAYSMNETVSVRPAEKLPAAHAAEATTELTPVLPDISAVEFKAEPAPAEELAAPAATAYTATISNKSTQRRPSFAAGEVLTLLWAVGALGVLLCQTVNYARFASLLRRSGKPDADAAALIEALSPRARARVLRSAAVPAPLLMGLGRGTIVLPEDELEEWELADVLRHELTHLRRRDTAWKWLALVALSLHWFNPILWLLRRSMNRDCELSCDAAVIAPMSPREKQHYGETLIRLSTRNTLPAALPASALSEGMEELRDRLTEIMRHKPMTPAGIWAAVACAALLCGCGTLVGSREEQPKEYYVSGDPYASAGDYWYATDGDPFYATDGDCIWNADGSTAYIEQDGCWFASSGNVYSDYYYAAFASDGNVYYPTWMLRPETVTVSTVDELLRAMEQDSVIVLKSGVYDLSEATVDFYPAAYWRPRDGAQQLRFSRLSSVCVRSESGDPADVTIIGGDGFSSGMMLEECWNVNFQGITFASHGGDECFRPAVELTDCFSVYFGNCVFTDPGSCLMTGDNANTITVEDCVFAASDPGAVFYGSNFLLFQRCEFGAGSLPTFSSDCRAVLITDCTAEGQPLRGEDVYALGGGDVTFH